MAADCMNNGGSRIDLKGVRGLQKCKLLVHSISGLE